MKALLEIRNKKLCIDGHAIGDEEYLLRVFEKAVKYDELKATFKEEGDV
ncbi:hypothetical protein [Methanobrevibacter sp.]|nr:hypothetical protein [Methanobrevibacter sp.]MBQ2832420.1 hypothetical protein [Methanobrevibacter sp.]